MNRFLILIPLILLVSCNGMNGRTIVPPATDAVHTNVEPQETTPVDSGEDDTLILCIQKSAIELTRGIPQGSVMAVIRISCSDEAIAEFAEELLIFALVQNGQYRIVERQYLDIIRQEQNFQLSGDVDDDTAVSIGKMTGANIVITGNILPYSTINYLNLRALDVETAQIRAASSRLFSSYW